MSLKNENLIFYKKNDKDRIEIIRTKFIDFIEANGFHKLKKTTPGYKWIRIENNVVKEVAAYEIKDFVMEHVKNQNQDNLREAVLKEVGSLMANSYLEILPTVEYKFKRGTKQRAYFYFENGFVEITSTGIEFKKYDQLDLPIWESKIIRHKIQLAGTGFSDFMAFAYRLADENEIRFKSLSTIIGYLVHDHKDASNARAVILTDTTIDHDGQANGGTGKSLLMKGIANVVETITLDGKNLKTKSNFLFQQVKEDTEILYLDDVKPEFSFETFYSAITEGITVERKYQGEHQIPFADAPKVVISSNYVVKGTGGNTDRRRRIDFEVSDYYRLNPAPANEFGHLFFDEWDDEQWNEFYLFMFTCVQLYLKEGLIQPASINLATNSLISQSSRDFVEFAKAELVAEGQYYKDDLLKKFKEKYPGNEGLVSNTFTKWISAWAEYKWESEKIIQKPSNGKNMVYIYHVQQ